VRGVHVESRTWAGGAPHREPVKVPVIPVYQARLEQDS
jgi:hypothetical protein